MGSVERKYLWNKEKGEHESYCVVCNSKFIARDCRNVFCSKKCYCEYKKRFNQHLARINTQEEKDSFRENILKTHPFLSEVETRICAGCGAEFSPIKIQQKYCSKKCGSLHRQSKYYQKIYDKISESPRNFIRNVMYAGKRYKKISLDYVMSIYEKQEGKCALSGRKMTFKRGNGRVPTNISIDRIDSDKGYVEGNIQLVCAVVNTMKAQFSQGDFIGLCKDIVKTTEEKQGDGGA